MNPMQKNESREGSRDTFELSSPTAAGGSESAADPEQYNSDFLEDLRSIERSASDVKYVKIDVSALRAQSRASSRHSKMQSTEEQSASAAIAAIAAASIEDAVAPEEKKKPFSEDVVGIIVAFALFVFSLVLSFCGLDMEIYEVQLQWPIGFAGFGYFVVVYTHYLLGKPQQIEGYATVLFICIFARSLGNYEELKDVGLSSSFWAIIVGIFFRNVMSMNPQLGLSGEYFVKIGITLLAMDFSAMSSVGPGLVVAWVDTAIVFFIGTSIAMYLFKLDLRSSIIVSGATCICGSSAATAIAGSVHSKSDFDREKTKDTTQTIIALMSMLNTPLMPLLPLLYTQYNVNPSVVGAWIGGSIDSTGQVIASASLGSSDAMLETATIIKMVQNVIIGPVCLALTMYFQKTLKLQIILDKFPLFVAGFFITSLVINIIRLSEVTTDHVADLTISNAWFTSEWVNLIGFAIIGLQIHVQSFVKNSSNHMILYSYLCIQTVDVVTTFGWSYLMFRNEERTDDDDA